MEHESLISYLSKICVIAAILSLFLRPRMSECFIILALVSFDIKLANSKCDNGIFFAFTLLTAISVFAAIV